jgi:hypothetical protein
MTSFSVAYRSYVDSPRQVERVDGEKREAGAEGRQLWEGANGAILD